MYKPQCLSCVQAHRELVTSLFQPVTQQMQCPLCCLCRCCALTRAPAAVDAALVAICHLAASSQLQNQLLEAGVLPYIVPLLLSYDVTLSPEVSARLQLPFSPPSAALGSVGVLEGGFKLLDSSLVRPNMQEARSQHALLAAQALGRIAGASCLVNATSQCVTAAAQRLIVPLPSVYCRMVCDSTQCVTKTYQLMLQYLHHSSLPRLVERSCPSNAWEGPRSAVIHITCKHLSAVFLTLVQVCYMTPTTLPATQQQSLPCQHCSLSPWQPDWLNPILGHCCCASIAAWRQHRSSGTAA